MKLWRYFDQNLIYFFDVSTKEEALKKLVEAVIAAKSPLEGTRFHKAIIEREKVVSTGIGMGVAIPHAKLPSYDDFFIAVGILKKGVDWNALDGAFVRLVFMIGGPDDKQTEYLKILSALTTFLRDEDIRLQLQMATSSQQVLRLFQES